MKMKSVCFGIRIVGFAVGAVLIFNISTSGQIKGEISKIQPAYYGCGDEIVGLFRQRTGSRWITTNSDEDKGIVMQNPNDVRNGIRTLSESEKLDPAYMLDFIRPLKSIRPEKCPNDVRVDGELITPLGKIFKFDSAVFNISKRRLKATTIERNGVRYVLETEIQEIPTRNPLDGGYVIGRSTLKALGKNIGEIVLEFEMSRYQ